MNLTNEVKADALDIYKIDGEHRESFLGGHFISTYKDCPRQFWFKYINRLTKNTSKAHFILGSAVHGGIEQWYRMKDEDIAMAYAWVYINENRKTYDDDERWLKDLEKAPKMVEAWLEAWILSGKEKDLKFIEAEIEHTINLPNGFPLTVRLDRLMYDENLNRYVIYDVKTTSRSVGTPISGMELGDQGLMYNYAVKQVYGETPAGLVVDVLYHRSLASGPSINVARSGLIDFADYAYLQWELNTISWLSEISQKTKTLMAGTYPEEILFPRKGGYSCMNCPFNDICRRKVIKGDIPPGFERDNWSGLDEALKVLKSDDFDKRMILKED